MQATQPAARGLPAVTLANAVRIASNLARMRTWSSAMTIYTPERDHLPRTDPNPRPGALSGTVPALIRVLRRAMSRSSERRAAPGSSSGRPGPVSPFLQGLVGPQDYWRGGNRD